MGTFVEIVLQAPNGDREIAARVVRRTHGMLQKCLQTLSRPDAYRYLHAKLLNSYAMDIPLAPSGQSGPAIAKVHKILEWMKEAEERRFPSVGLGEDCR